MAANKIDVSPQKNSGGESNKKLKFSTKNYFQHVVMHCYGLFRLLLLFLFLSAGLCCCLCNARI